MLNPEAQVRKLYERLERNERNRIRAAAAASSASGKRAPPPSFVPALRVVSDTGAAATAEPLPARAAANLGAGEKDGNARPAVARNAALDNGGPVKQELSAVGGGGPAAQSYGLDGSKGRCGAGGQNALQIGEFLQEAVRLCSLGGVATEEAGGGVGAPPPPGVLTLSEAELSRPRRLLEGLRAFSCRRSDGEAAGSEDEAQGKKGKSVVNGGGFLRQSLTEADARRAAMVPMEDPLMETAWLAERFPKATLADLLLNRLELSLWASFWRRERPAESLE